CLSVFLHPTIHPSIDTHPLVCALFFLPQDALLRLASVVDVNNLRVAIKETLESLLPKVESVFVYLLEEESQLVCEDPPHEIPPHEGCTIL
uniref:Uncharacterized protein n=1 Tax=Astyanax mexicanus TaxID=7994 RepID=A0A3B1IKY3_ASTMX